tara:strand:+ start:1063 stop:1563 length:501 start_codon:yes stop_codon:yes gene_type:complete
MKRVVILSATSKSNLELAKSLETILSKLNVTTKIINLEEYSFPLYSSSKEEEGPPANVFDLSNKLVESDGMVICAPEYNGGVPPVVSNAIAWISVTTKNWRDGFNGKKGVVASSSGGAANRYIASMKSQLEHLGMIVLPRTIVVSSSKPINKKSSKQILLQLSKIL